MFYHPGRWAEAKLAHERSSSRRSRKANSFYDKDNTKAKVAEMRRRVEQLEKDNLTSPNR
jgi:hypothetical protein